MMHGKKKIFFIFLYLVHTITAKEAALELMLGPAWQQFEASTLPASADGSTSFLQQVSYVSAYNLAALNEGSFSYYIPRTPLYLQGALGASWLRFGRGDLKSSALKGGSFVTRDTGFQTRISLDVTAVHGKGGVKIPFPEPFNLHISAGYTYAQEICTIAVLATPIVLFEKATNKGPLVAIQLGVELPKIEVSAQYQAGFNNLTALLTDNQGLSVAIRRVSLLGTSFSIKLAYLLNENFKVIQKLSYDHQKNRKTGTTALYTDSVFQSIIPNLASVVANSVDIAFGIEYEF